MRTKNQNTDATDMITPKFTRRMEESLKAITSKQPKSEGRGTMPILKAQRIVRRYLRYGVVLHGKGETPETQAHAQKQLDRIDKTLDAALRRIG